VSSNSTVVQGAGPELAERWPALAQTMHAAGYRAVHAHPLRWQGQAVGAITFFHSKEYVEPDALLLGQALSDVATMRLAMTPQGAETSFVARIGEALKARIVIEQAKGVLAQQSRISGEDAYTALLRLAHAKGTTLSVAATRLVQGAQKT
jgi:hypothetical protein